MYVDKMLHHNSNREKKSKCYISILTSKKDTDVKNSHDEVRNDTYTVSFSVFRFSGRPVQSVQDVLSKRGKEAVSHLTVKLNPQRVRVKILN